MDDAYRDAFAAIEDRQKRASAQVAALDSRIPWIVWAGVEPKLRMRAQALRKRVAALRANTRGEMVARTDALTELCGILEHVVAQIPHASTTLSQIRDDAPAVEPCCLRLFPLYRSGLYHDDVILREISRHDPQHTATAGQDSLVHLRFRAWGVPFFLAVRAEIDRQFLLRDVCFALATRLPDAVPPMAVRCRGVIDRAFDVLSRSRRRTGDPVFDNAFAVDAPDWGMSLFRGAFRAAMTRLETEKVVRLDVGSGTARLQWSGQSDVFALRAAINALRDLREAAMVVHPAHTGSAD